jgi:hypothetical protein
MKSAVNPMERSRKATFSLNYRTYDLFPSFQSLTNTSLFTISAYKTYDNYRAQQSKRKVSSYFHSGLVGFQQRDGRCRDLN